MTGPATPSLGPREPAWQLVEVAQGVAQAAGAGRSRPSSVQNSPSIPLLQSPYTKPAESKTDAEEQWTLDEGGASEGYASGYAAGYAHGWHREWRRPRRRQWSDQEVTGEWHSEAEQGLNQHIVAEDGFHPWNFVGEWRDNIGHRVLVSAVEPRGHRRGGPKLSFLAILQKPGIPDKRFTIAKDSWKPEWTCGNGVLVKEKSDRESLTWCAADGRMSTWTRPPPEGCVYFDAPPRSREEELAMQEAEAWMMQQQYYLVPEMEGDTKEQDPIIESAEEEALLAEATATRSLNPSAPEFVPIPPTPAMSSAPSPAWGPAAAPRRTSQCRASPQVAPMASPVMKIRSWGRTPTPSPLFGPLVSPHMGYAVGMLPTALEPLEAEDEHTRLHLSEESPDVRIDGSSLEWCLPDDWGKLSRFPKDFCITSPMFGIKSASNMQLAFYPNGSRASEQSHCTVALTRGPDSAGIKFEFTVNGRGIGPKVCLGRRYLGDYPKPFDDSEGNKSMKVVVSMQVLEVLRAP